MYGVEQRLGNHNKQQINTRLYFCLLLGKSIKRPDFYLNTILHGTTQLISGSGLKGTSGLDILGGQKVRYGPINKLSLYST